MRLINAINAIEASIQTGGKLVAAQGPVALEGSVGIARNTAVALNQ
jgi:hypothetical protein